MKIVVAIRVIRAIFAFMADLRVNEVDQDLLFDLKVIALDQQTTLRQLVIDVLTAFRNRKAQTGSKNIRKGA